MERPDPKRVARLHLAIQQPDPLYPDAGKNAQPEVVEALARWQELPQEEKVKGPLWHWLLGAPTPHYKLPPDAADYQDPSPVDGQTCGNCKYAYQHVVDDKYICSIIRGPIELPAWCRLWGAPDGG